MIPHICGLRPACHRLRAREVSALVRSAKHVEAIHIVLTSDTWREPGEELETGHSATPPGAV
jgi:hypothetical protein